MSVAPDPNSIEWTNAVLSQPVNFTDITGETITVPLDAIDSYHTVLARSLIIFGVEIGLTFMLITVLLLLTKPDKRRTVIFGLNIAGLSFQFLRSLMVAILYNGPARSVGMVFLGAFATMTTTDYAPEYFYIVATIIWYAIVETSLILQVRVVFGAERKVQQYLTYGLGLLGLATVSTQTTVQSFVFKAALENAEINDPSFFKLALAARILFAISIGISSSVFVAKLIYLIHRRRKMGFKSFGPLQVILIMSAQCLIIPSTPPSLTNINMCSVLFHRRLLRQHRRFHYSGPNFPILLPPSLCPLGLLRSRKIKQHPSPSVLRKLLGHNRLRRQ
jgi:pheromone alpha factor receptor